ncbi:MAG: beta-galactosidase [Terrimicrobiaceae bacterium]
MLKTTTILAAGVLLSLCGLSPLAAETPSAPLSPFGIGGDHKTAQTPEKWIPQMAALGIKVNRNCRVHWQSVEPREGEWDWKDVDRRIQVMADNGIETGGVFIGSPSWNTADPSGTLPVNNLVGWSNYVTETVKHCKGKVKYWELWNEPPNFTGKNQTSADYAKLAVATYDAAKAADPDCKIGLAAKSAHINYIEEAIRAGAKDHFDYITLHPYEVLGGVLRDQGTEAIYMSIVPNVRKMLARVNPEKADAPVWFTELGVDSGPPGKGYGMGADIAAHGLIKAYTMGLAQGVACINWFEGMDGDSGAMGLLDAAGKPRLTHTAMSQMIRHLGPHPAYLGWVLLNGKHYGFVFQGAKGPVLITWAYKGISDQMDFGRTVSTVDPLTGNATDAAKVELTKAPVFVLDAPANLVAQAAANKDKPLPWEGDYTDAKSVSITFGEKTVEKGLHTQAGDAVAADVLAYGGSARAGSVPGGTVFMVDPNFLSGRPGPIRITAVVRRNEANDEAGFKLNYESPVRGGYKTATPGWFNVPDNKQWHTAAWDIDDAQFANMWGYNFSLNSDGSKFNKYYIQSVTVEKLNK